MLGFFTMPAYSQRFLSEVFPSVNVTTNVVYAQNYEVLTGTPVLKDLKMDVYEPAGAADPMTERPLIIYLHTGSYIPIIVNGNATGSRNDSAAVEICKQFARRGYVVANMDYRLGWDPTNTNPTNGLDIRRGTLLNAVYRSIQDAKSCVRYFRKDAATNKNKLARFATFTSASQNGFVYVVDSSFSNKATLEAFYRELESFDGSRSTATIKDDWVDACSDAFNYLQKKKVYRTPAILPINAPTSISGLSPVY